MSGARVGVIGAGIVGLSTAHALASRDADVRVYEAAIPGNGQSGGESRVFRHAHGDARLVEMAMEARAIWRSWEQEFGVELVSLDGAVAIGDGLEEKLDTLHRAGHADARMAEPAALADWQPLLAPYHGPVLLDPAGGAIRTRAAIDALSAPLHGSGALVADEVISFRPVGEGVELRSGGQTTTFDHVVVCAGMRTAGLARTAGLELPVSTAAHVRLTFAVEGEPPARLACLQDSSGEWGEVGVYAAPTPGNRQSAVGLAGTTPAHGDGSMLDPEELSDLAGRARRYVSRALPGLRSDPVDVRHCWVTELPWSSDGVAAWEAGPVTFVAGHNLFKQAPAIGSALAARALGEPLREDLRPGARLG